MGKGNGVKRNRVKLPDKWNGTFLSSNNWAETNSSRGGGYSPIKVMGALVVPFRGLNDDL